MIIIDYEQGTPEWHDVRRGVITASEFSKIVTPTGKRSAQWEKYQAELLAQWALGDDYHENTYENRAIERGRELEEEARAYYEFTTGNECKKVGFVFQDEAKTVGCSPDSLVGDDGALEIKCPEAATHIQYLLEGRGLKYYPQIQSSLWITGLMWWDFLSYYPGLPPVLERIEPDMKLHEIYDNLIAEFLEELKSNKQRLKSLGIQGVK